METSPSSSNQACAACKHRRTRCNPNCDLAPYFPANKYDDFRSVKKLFGVSNIAKIMSWIEPHRRQAAADSMLVEANARESDPVYGCYGVIRELTARIEFAERELSVVKEQLEFHKRQQMRKREQDRFYDCLNGLPDPYFGSDMQADELIGDIHSHKSTLVEATDEESAVDMEHKEAFDDDRNSSASFNS